MRLQPDLLASLDAYITQLAPSSSRPEAIRKLASDALKGMGLRKPDAD